MIFFYLFLANLLVQIPNVIGILYFSNKMTTTNMIYLSLATFPVVLGGSFLFILYYMKGSFSFSYPMLVIFNVGITIFVGFLMGVFVLKNQTYSIYDLIGFTLIALGVLLVVFKKQLF